MPATLGAFAVPFQTSYRRRHIILISLVMLVRMVLPTLGVAAQFATAIVAAEFMQEYAQSPGIVESREEHVQDYNAISALRPVPIITIVRDGQTCPDEYTTATLRDVQGHGRTCQYGQLVGNRLVTERSATCCYQQDQHVFLLSTEGGQNHANAQYILDARDCCLPSMGEKEATTEQGQCTYGDANLKVPSIRGAKHCCWNETGKDFTVHLPDYSSGFKIPKKLFEEKGTFKKSTHDDYCKTIEVEASILEATLFSSYATIRVWVHLKCAKYGLTSTKSQTLTVKLKSAKTRAGSFRFFDIGLGTYINVEIDTQIKKDDNDPFEYDFRLSAIVSGAGLLGKVYKNLDPLYSFHDDALDEVLDERGVC